MKHLLFTIVLFFSLFSSLQAQFGIRAGLSGTNLRSEVSGLSQDGSTKLNFHFGIVYDLPIPGNLGLRTGLLFNQKGNDEKEVDASLVQPLSFNYLEIPLSLLFDVTELIFIEAGPTFGYLLSASSFDSDVKEEFKSVEVGANLGGGIDLSLVKIGLNYNYGLTNIANVSDIGFDTEAKHKGFTLYGIISF